MTSRPPFEFNLSAAADKKRKKTGRRGMSGAFETSDKACDYPGCGVKAAYRAPKRVCSPKRWPRSAHQIP